MAVSLSALFFTILDWIGAVLAAYWWAFAIFGILAWRLWKRRQEAQYNYKVRAFKRREGNRKVEVNYPAGYFKDKHGITFFQVKLGKMPWNVRKMYDLPNAEYMDEEGRVHYEIINPNTWIQIKKSFIPSKVTLVEIEFLKDYGVYKVGHTGFILEDHVNVLAKIPGTIKLTGKKEEQEVTDVTYIAVSSAEKKLIATEFAEVKDMLGAGDWKSTAIWAGGIVGLLLAGLLAYLFVSGNLTG